MFSSQNRISNSSISPLSLSTTRRTAEEKAAEEPRGLFGEVELLLLFLKGKLAELLFKSTDEISELASSEVETPFSPADSDIFQFGRYWHYFRDLAKTGALRGLIEERKNEILALKEHWRPLMEELDPRVKKTLEEGYLLRAPEGAGAAYFLMDPEGAAQFVIKPMDEDILCLNNPKWCASPFNDPDFRLKNSIPLYRCPQTEVLASRVAEALDLSHITPRAEMGIVYSKQFHDICDALDREARKGFRFDKEKLCSIQEYIPETRMLYDVLQEWQTDDLSNEQIEARIDQTEFEEANLFIWTTYDTDAHAGNLLLYPKYLPEEGEPLFGLKKIDNGLCFPEKNSGLLNSLSVLPNAKQPISPSLREKIANIPVDTIDELLEKYEMQSTRTAFMERIEILQTLALREAITLEEIDFRLQLLQNEQGRELALGPIDLDQMRNPCLVTT